MTKPNVLSWSVLGKFQQVIPALPNIPTDGGVYVIGIRTKESALPFYVGQTENLRRRIGEYYIASNATSTDVRVGNVTKHFQDEKTEVTVMFEPMIIADEKERKKEEDSVTTQLQEKLNELNEIFEAKLQLVQGRLTPLEVNTVAQEFLRVAPLIETAKEKLRGH